MEHIIIEMKIIQLQLYLAKHSVNQIYSPLSTPSKVELHIEHSLTNLDHLISYIDDLKKMQSNNSVVTE